MSNDEIYQGLTRAVDRLMTALAGKQDELRRRELSCGSSHDVRKMTRLREEIKSIEGRLTIAENLQESYLRKTP